MLDRSFYEKSLRPDRQYSYKCIANAIVNIFGPRSVLDLGCGVGWLLYYLSMRGVDVRGIEPSDGARPIMDQRITKLITQDDISHPINLDARFDLTISLEVVEHIDKAYATIAIENITRYSDVVLFSAAKPGQGGCGHINEQPAEYWIELFNLNSFQLDHKYTDMVVRQFAADKVKYWYINNSLVMRRHK